MKAKHTKAQNQHSPIQKTSQDWNLFMRFILATRDHVSIAVLLIKNKKISEIIPIKA